MWFKKNKNTFQEKDPNGLVLKEVVVEPGQAMRIQDLNALHIIQNGTGQAFYVNQNGTWKITEDITINPKYKDMSYKADFEDNRSPLQKAIDNAVQELK